MSGLTVIQDNLDKLSWLPAINVYTSDMQQLFEAPQPEAIGGAIFYIAPKYQPANWSVYGIPVTNSYGTSLQSVISYIDSKAPGAYYIYGITQFGSDSGGDVEWSYLYNDLPFDALDGTVIEKNLDKFNWLPADSFYTSGMEQAYQQSRPNAVSGTLFFIVPESAPTSGYAAIAVGDSIATSVSSVTDYINSQVSGAFSSYYVYGVMHYGPIPGLSDWSYVFNGLPPGSEKIPPPIRHHKSRSPPSHGGTGPPPPPPPHNLPTRQKRHNLPPPPPAIMSGMSGAEKIAIGILILLIIVIVIMVMIHFYDNKGSQD